MFDTLSQTTAIIFAATSRAVLASPRPPAPCPGGCFWALMIYVKPVLNRIRFSEICLEICTQRFTRSDKSLSL